MPIFPAASVARTITRCAFLQIGNSQRDLLLARVKQLVVGEDRRPGAAVDCIVRLHHPRQLVLEHDRSTGPLGSDLHDRRIVVDHECEALPLPRQGVIRTVGGTIAGQDLQAIDPRGKRGRVPGKCLLRERLAIEPDPFRPAFLAHRERVVHVVFIGVGGIPADGEPRLLRRPVAAAGVGNVEPCDLRRQVCRPEAERH